MNFTFDYFSISLLIGGFVALLAGLTVYLHGEKNVENTSWFFFNLASAIWSFGYFATINATSQKIAFITDWVLHEAAILVPLTYLISVIFLTNSYEKRKKVIFFFSTISLFFLITASSDLFVRDVIPKKGFNFVPDAGPLYIFFTIYFFSLVLYILYILITKYRSLSNSLEKERYKYMIIFTTIGSFGGGSVFLLTFNIPILPYPLILFSLFPVISIYAIFRYKLFNTKVISTELAIFILWIIILLRIFLSTNWIDRLIDIGLLIFVISVGILLIKSVLKEVQLREKIEILAKDLEKANQSLESANDRLKELDQLKSEFLSLATHQIRAPLTAIKGYASMIMEGDFGKTSVKVNGAVKTIFQSCQNLVVIVNEFLDISRIEQGRMKYDLSDFDVKKLCTDIINELRPNVENAHLTIDFSADEKETYTVHADIGKVKQVIGNIIDNSIKYTPQGGITISLEKIEKKTRIRIKDTGIGIEATDIPKLFGKFVRTKDANKTNVIGTGLGLYVSKQMIEAQGGKVWVESEGLGKGSSFMIEL